MPGTKRKVDEDTWITTQSKKFKASLLLSNIHEKTLAHLRLGARKLFGQIASPPDSSQQSTSRDYRPRVNTTTLCEQCSHSQINDSMDFESVVCYYCEAKVCHVSKCEFCQNSFCTKCCVNRYTNPNMDTFVCIGCLG